MKRLIATAVIGLALLPGCRKGPGTPTPTPTPTPVETPPPPTPPPVRFPVIAGDRFDPPIVGYSVCCASGGPVNEGLRDGWALATYAAMQWAQDHAGGNLNAIIFRTGPYDAANDTMAGLRQAVVDANALGLLPVVDLVDGWALVHKVNLFGDSCAVTQDRADGKYRDHVRAVAERTRGLKVIYTVGNEIERCNPSAAWVDSIATAIKEFDSNAKVGSSIRAPSSGIVDFDTYHGFEPRGPRGRPMLMDESNNKDYRPEEWWALISHNNSIGGNTIYWPGPHDDGERAATLSLIKAGNPAPPPAQNRARAVRLTLRVYRPDPCCAVGEQAVIDATAKDAQGRETWGEAGEVEFWHFDGACRQVGGKHPFQRRVTGTCAGTVSGWASIDGVQSNTIEWEVR